MPRSASLVCMTKLFGITLAILGVAHFIVPERFRGLTSVAFSENIDDAITQNGAIETAVGTAIAFSKTRKVGFLGLGAYLTWLGYNAAANQ